MTGRYLEDFAVGQTFGSGRLRIDRRRIEIFAAETEIPLSNVNHLMSNSR